MEIFRGQQAREWPSTRALQSVAGSGSGNCTSTPRRGKEEIPIKAPKRGRFLGTEKIWFPYRPGKAGRNISEGGVGWYVIIEVR